MNTEYTNDPLTRVLDALPDARKSGDGYVARCPAHDDRNASLSVSMGSDGRVLLCCHAGCGSDAVAGAIGLELRNLFPPKNAPATGTQPKPRLVKTYPYTDADGVLRYEVCRYEPKDFRQRQPDGKGGYVWNLKGVASLLYRLPEVLAVVRDRRTVFVVEGEKDADALAAFGVCATTNAGGAAKWRESFADVLTGANVVMLPDNDEPGRIHAQTVARSLHGKAAKIRVVALPNLPAKGDVFDWIREGGTREALNALVKQTPDYAPDAASPSEQEPDTQNHGAVATDESNYPEPLAEAAFCGLAGEIVRAIEPHTESDPAALLVQFLVAFGNIVGRDAHYLVEADKHFANENVCLVGRSGKARKGTSWGYVKRLFADAEPEDTGWQKTCIRSGLSSGEGLIQAVADDTDGEATGGKRLLAVESEFASLLRVMERDGNTISARLRDCFDTGDLSTLTRNPLRATGAHISMVGHITADELRRYLTRTESGNGFANRILWVCAKRSKLLPDGGNLSPEVMRPLTARLQDAVSWAKQRERIQRDTEASALWGQVYPYLSRDVPGLLGAVTSRAEAHVVRLSLIYALLDGTDAICPRHLRAALAVWQYCEASARFVFGDTQGDLVADTVLAALRHAAPQGITLTELHEVLQKNHKGARVQAALSSLQQAGLARCEKQVSENSSAGRPAQTWFAINTQNGDGANEINEIIAGCDP